MDFLQSMTDDQVALLGCGVALFLCGGAMVISGRLSRLVKTPSTARTIEADGATTVKPLPVQAERPKKTAA